MSASSNDPRQHPLEQVPQVPYGPGVMGRTAPIPGHSAVGDAESGMGSGPRPQARRRSTPACTDRRWDTHRSPRGRKRTSRRTKPNNHTAWTNGNSPRSYPSSDWVGEGEPTADRHGEQRQRRTRTAGSRPTRPSRRQKFSSQQAPRAGGRHGVRPHGPESGPTAVLFSVPAWPQSSQVSWPGAPARMALAACAVEAIPQASWAR